MADVIHLRCSDCRRINYLSFRNKRKNPNKIKKRKYCRFERKHTVHEEK